MEVACLLEIDIFAERLEMCLAAFDFRAFRRAQRVFGGVAFRLDDEVQALFAGVVFHDNGPVGIVRAERRVDLEPVRQLRVELDRVVVLECLGKALLVVAVINDVVVERMAAFDHVLFEVSGQLFLLEQFLRIKRIVADPRVLDAIDDHALHDVLHDFRDTIHEDLRILAEKMQPLRLHERVHDGFAREVRLVLEVRHDVRQRTGACDATAIDVARLRRVDARFTDGEQRRRKHELRRGDGQLVLDASRDFRDELPAVKVHMIRRLPLDALPKLLERR